MVVMFSQAVIIVGNSSCSSGVNVGVVNDPRRPKMPAAAVAVTTTTAVSASRATAAKIQRPQEKQAAQGCCLTTLSVVMLLYR